MTSKLRSAAETRFAAILRREDSAMSAVEEERQALREKTARLRAQRLAHEAQTVLDRASQLKARRRTKTAL